MGTDHGRLRAELAGPFVTLLVAAVVEVLRWTPLSIPNPAAFLVLAVVFSAFTGGLRPGLISAATAWVYVAYFFSLPNAPFRYSPVEARRVGVWVVVMPAIAALVGVLHRRSLRQAERRIEESEVALVEERDSRRALEDQLRESQKMEAVGRLAGGVAHDFNNLLTVISGYADLGLATVGRDDPLYSSLREIRTAGERAARLTKQLLAFSRRQVLQPKVLDLSSLLEREERMLCRLIGDDVRLETRLARPLGSVKADPGQIEQVILNLAINARDAMPRGGSLTIATSSVEMDVETARRAQCPSPGRYVRLAVTDTGCGMSEETLSHIFEPFFTTKEVGKGTGLGLPMVYGFVHQSGGGLEVKSRPGEGTEFVVYLPQVDESIAVEASGAAVAAGENGEA